MARVTSEDCVRVIKNRFELVLFASFRARALAAGAQPTVSRRNDSFSVISLREIAEDNLNLEDMALPVKRYYIHQAPHAEEEVADEFLESEELLAKEVFDEIRRTKESEFLFEDGDD